MEREILINQERIHDLRQEANRRRLQHEANPTPVHPIKSARVAIGRGLIAIGKSMSDN